MTTANQIMLQEAKFVLNYFKRNLETVITAATELKGLYQDNHKFQNRLFTLINIKPNTDQQMAEDNYNFMCQVFRDSLFNGLDSDFYIGYYACMMAIRYEENGRDSFIGEVRALDVICPEIMLKEYLMFCIMVAGNYGNMELLEYAYTKHETLFGGA